MRKSKEEIFDMLMQGDSIKPVKKRKIRIICRSKVQQTELPPSCFNGGHAEYNLRGIKGVC